MPYDRTVVRRSFVDGFRLAWVIPVYNPFRSGKPEQSVRTAGRQVARARGTDFIHDGTPHAVQRRAGASPCCTGFDQFCQLCGPPGAEPPAAVAPAAFWRDGLAVGITADRAADCARPGKHSFRL